MSSPYLTTFNYQGWIEARLTIVDKTSHEIPFVLNPVQSLYVSNATNRDFILKARQQGFNSLILALFTADFLLKANTLSVVVADTLDNATDLLGRVKRYIRALEQFKGTKVPLKYNSKYELVNAANDLRYIIGTAENTQFGRSKTINNLHLSEAAFYKQFMNIMAGAGSAVVPDGRIIIETTANGFNDAKTFWDDTTMGLTGFTGHFLRASAFYGTQELGIERQRLGERLFRQEFPESAEEAFITSGATYVDNLALARLLETVTLWEQNHAVAR